MLKQLPRSNLSIKEKDALKTLFEREDIIITKANKGGPVVIIDADDYDKEANQHSNQTTPNFVGNCQTIQQN